MLKIGTHAVNPAGIARAYVGTALVYLKNLIRMTAENIVVGKYINNSGAVTSSLQNFYYSDYVPVRPGTTYTLHISESVSYVSFMEYSSSKGFIRRTLFGSPAGDTISITTGSNTAYMLWGSNIDSSNLTLAAVQALEWRLTLAS